MAWIGTRSRGAIPESNSTRTRAARAVTNPMTLPGGQWLLPSHNGRTAMRRVPTPVVEPLVSRSPSAQHTSRSPGRGGLAITAHVRSPAVPQASSTLGASGSPPEQRVSSLPMVHTMSSPYWPGGAPTGRRISRGPVGLASRLPATTTANRTTAARADLPAARRHRRWRPRRGAASGPGVRPWLAAASASSSSRSRRSVIMGIAPPGGRPAWPPAPAGPGRAGS